jgi:hypothetical protein
MEFFTAELLKHTELYMVQSCFEHLFTGFAGLESITHRHQYFSAIWDTIPIVSDLVGKFGYSEKSKIVVLL